MSKFWSPFVKDLVPYVPGEQPKLAKLVKLNTNENPYGPSPKAIAAMQAELGDSLRLYPDPNSDRLKQAVADYYGVSTAEVFVGNGSDEVLAHAFHGLFQHGKPLLFPDVTYSFYPVYCGLYGIQHEALALDEQFQIRPEDYARPNGGIIFPNPNAPTGCLLPLDAIERISKELPECGIVLGLSNISFGLKPAARQVLNSVFNDHAVKRGMTGAIVHVSKILPLHTLAAEEVKVAEDLVFDRRAEGYDPLQAFIALFADRKADAGAARERPAPDGRGHRPAGGPDAADPLAIAWRDATPGAPRGDGLRPRHDLRLGGGPTPDVLPAQPALSSRDPAGHRHPFLRLQQPALTAGTRGRGSARGGVADPGRPAVAA